MQNKLKNNPPLTKEEQIELNKLLAKYGDQVENEKDMYEKLKKKLANGEKLTPEEFFLFNALDNKYNPEKIKDREI